MDEHSIFSRKSYEKVGVELPKNLKGDSVSCYEAAAPYVDLIIAVDTPTNNITNKLLELPLVKSNKKKLVSINIDDEENPDFSITASALNDLLTKHFA